MFFFSRFDSLKSQKTKVDEVETIQKGFKVLKFFRDTIEFYDIVRRFYVKYDEIYSFGLIIVGEELFGVDFDF